MNSLHPATALKEAPENLTSASRDDELRSALHRAPGLIQRVFGEASACHHRLIQNPHIPQLELGISEFWTRESFRYRNALPRSQLGGAIDQTYVDDAAVKAFRIALDVRDALRDLESDLPLLNHADLLALRGQVPPEAAAKAVAAIWEKGPGLKAWRARRQAAAEAAQAVIEATRERQAQAFAAHSKAARGEAARTLLRRLAGDGVHLAVAKQNLLAHPAALLTDEHRAALVEFRAELVAILAAQPEIVGLQAAAE